MLLQSWPFFKKIFVGNQANQIMPMLLLPGTLPSKLQKSPAHLTHFVEKCLQWHPDARMTAASASNHMFVTPLPMSLLVNVAKGKKRIRLSCTWFSR